MKRLLITAAITVLLLVMGACQQTEDGTGILIRTADPALSIFVPIPAAEVGEAMPVTQPPPPCIIVKSNVSSSGEKIYHLPGMASYDLVKIDETRGEAFHCSEQEAIDAGFRKAQR